MWVVLILGLVAAGVYTSSTGFYVAAGIAGAVIALWMFVAALAVRAIKRKIDNDFDSFKKFKRF